MRQFLKLCTLIDAMSRQFGKIAIWFVLSAALVSALNALLRYGINGFLWLETYSNGRLGIGALFNIYRNNSNSLSELQIYLFAGMVMFGGAWTLAMNGHVRVDVIYGSVSERTRKWIDLLGGVFFLLPICMLLIYLTWPWFLESWYNNESSTNAGGLLRWPIKFCLPFGFFLLALQSVSEIIKAIAALHGIHVQSRAYEKPVQ